MKEKTRKVIERLSLTIFVFSLLCVVYIMGNAWFHPQSLVWPLSHYAPWPREDNFATFNFFVSFISFLIWNLTRK